MTIYVTRHMESAAVSGTVGTVPELPIEGQRLPVATDSQSFAGPGELRIASDVDCFVAISKVPGAPDPAAASALWMPGGSVQWIHVPAGDWKVRWSA